MTMTRVALLTLLVSVFACSAAIAKLSAHPKDGSEVQARKALRDDGMSQLQENGDSKVESYEPEIKLPKTRLGKKQRKKLLDQIIEVSGTRKQLENLLKHSATDDDFDAILKESYNSDAALKVVRGHFAKKLGDRDLVDVLAWFGSPVGRKIAEAEALPEPDKKEKMKAFMDREATPETKERLEILARIDRSEGLAEVQRGIASRMIRRVARSIPADFPDRATMLEKMDSGVPSLETLRSENAAKSAYTLRDISTAELRDYLRFLQSPAGEHYSSAMVNAAREIFGAVMDKLADHFIKKLKEIAAEARNSRPVAAGPADICALAASEVRKRLPLKIDAVTTATGISCDSTTVVYQLRIRNGYEDTLIKNPAAKEDDIKARICGNTSLMETHLSKGVSIKYSYYDEAGKPLLAFVVTAADCGL